MSLILMVGLGGGHYYRYFLNMKTGASRAEKVVDTESEFPTFNPSVAGVRHRYTYTACSIDNGADSFFNGIAKVDFDGSADTLALPQGYYGSEPGSRPARRLGLKIMATCWRWFTTGSIM